MNFFNTNNINKNIHYPDIYFTPEYGKACECSDNAEWELCQFKDLIYVYLKRPYVFDEKTYYDLISPYGYAGYYFEKQETFDEFIPLFREESIKRNYLTEVVKQTPYFNIDIESCYQVITRKKICSIEVNNYENYYKNTLNSKIRNKIKKATKHNMTHTITPMSSDLLKSNFLPLYNFTMDKVNADKYYYFNDEYYKCIEQLPQSYLVDVINTEKQVIGSSIIFTHRDFVHYHLSCNDNSSNCITNYLLSSVVREMAVGKRFIIGCGVSKDDSLYEFKKNISTHESDYTIYKNVLNSEIYTKITKDVLNKDYFPAHRQ